MLLTPLTERALNAAAKLHDGQYRKKSRLPYITHLVATASIVSMHSSDEEVVAAALLHDTLEDTAYTEEELHAEFGPRVAELVLSVTIPEMLEGEGADWGRDRRRYCEQIVSAPDAAALIVAADKLHNFRCIAFEYGDDAAAFRKDFGGSSEDRIAVYGAIVRAVEDRIPAELASELKAAWDGYHDFLKTL